MDKKQRIATLNDQLRRHHVGGKALITAGIQALGVEVVTDIRAAIAAFADFTPDNDPYGEHDCAVMTVAERRVIWKIDYYDRQMTYASPDPADPAVTIRVMTIMLADEW
jgi:hypothetical protein